MKKYSYIILLILLSLFTKVSHSQLHDYPIIKKMSQPKQEYGKPIIYQFPDVVNQLIDDYIKNRQDSISFFNIEIDVKDNGYTIILRKSNIAMIQDSTNFEGLLLSSSYRTCKIGDRNIPIYLSSDKELGFYNFVITGDELILNLKRKSYHVFEIIDYQINR